MERRLTRLARTLRQVAHDAGLALLCPRDPAVTRYCIARYNRVRACLADPLPEAAVFPVLPDDASAGDVRMAAHAFALYLDGVLRRQRARDRIAAWLDWLCPARFFTPDFS